MNARLARLTIPIIACIAAGCASAPLVSPTPAATTQQPTAAPSSRPSAGPPATVLPKPTEAWDLFRAPVHLAVAIWPVIVADFDRDGNQDIAGVHGDGGAASLLLGHGDGTFENARDFPGDGEGPTRIAAADLNGDDRLDFILTHAGVSDMGTGSDDVVVLLEKRDGSFKRLVRSAGSSPQMLTIGDFNGDGKPDLATANNADHISIFVGRGDGTFANPRDVPIDAPFASGIDTADFDDDGDLDLVTTNSLVGAGRSVRTVSVVLGRGDGTFGAATTYPIGGPQPIMPLVADFNGDGAADIATADGFPTDKVSVLLGAGDGSFGPSVEWVIGYNSHGIVSVDLNGDGHADLISGNLGANGGPLGRGIGILFGNGDGTFQDRVEMTGPAFGLAAAGDLDGDRKVDLIATGEDEVTLLFNAMEFTR